MGRSVIEKAAAEFGNDPSTAQTAPAVTATWSRVVPDSPAAPSPGSRTFRRFSVGGNAPPARPPTCSALSPVARWHSSTMSPPLSSMSNSTASARARCRSDPNSPRRSDDSESPTHR